MFLSLKCMQNNPHFTFKLKKKIHACFNMCYNQPVVYFDSLHAKSVRTCQMLLVLPNRTE